MKTFFIIISIISIQYSLFAQDRIILKNADTIKCKIIEDKIVYLKYKLFNTQDTSIYQINQDLYDYYTIEATDGYETKNKAILYPIVDIIKNKKPLKKGVYLNVKQFVDNTPAYDFDFKVIEIDKTTNLALERGNDYQVESYTATISDKKIDKDFWGVCDGVNCYINCHMFSSHKYYSLIKCENDLIYFSSIPFNYLYEADSSLNNKPVKGTVGGVIGGSQGVVINNFERKKYIILLSSGRIVPY